MLDKELMSEIFNVDHFLIRTSHKYVGGWVWVYLVFTSHATIFQSYMWRHRCGGVLKKKLYLRSSSQRHRHFAGFFDMPVLHRHGTTLFIRWFRHTAPFSRLLRHAWDMEGVLTGAQRKSQDKSLMCPYFNLLFTLFPPVHLHIIVPVTWIDVYLTDRNL